MGRRPGLHHTRLYSPTCRGNCERGRMFPARSGKPGSSAAGVTSMIYMLNLVFDGSDTTESNNGRFKEYDSTQPLLQQSQIWLKQSNPANPTPNPDVTTDWNSLQ